MLSLQGSVRLQLEFYPGVERRLSMHVWPSSSLQPKAQKTAHQLQCFCHHQSDVVHIIHLPDNVTLLGNNCDSTPHVIGDSTLCSGRGKLDVVVSLKDLKWTTNAQLTEDGLQKVIQACINIDLYDHIRNSHREDCMNQAGSVCIPLVDLLHTVNVQKRLNYEMVIPGMRSQHYVKGIFSYDGVRESARVLIDNKPVLIETNNEIYTRILTTVIQPNIELLNKPVQRWREFFKHTIHPRYKCLNGINMFVYDARKWREHVFGYVCCKIPESNVTFYKNALDIVLRRYNISSEQWLSISLDPPLSTNNCSAAAAASTLKWRSCIPERVLGKVLSLFVNNLNYLLDGVYTGLDTRGKAKLQNIESFDFCRVSSKLDCEDSALEMMFEFSELLILGQNRTALSADLCKLIDVANLYYPFMWLVGVSSIEINEERMGSLDDMDAHMHTALVPKATWAEWMVRSRGPQMPVVTTLGDSNISFERSKYSPGIIILEGTGYLEPTGDDPTIDDRSSIYDIIKLKGSNALNTIRKEYGIKRGDASHFYKMVVTSYTNSYFLRNQMCSNTTYNLSSPSLVPGESQHFCGFAMVHADDLNSYGVRFQDINTWNSTAINTTAMWNVDGDKSRPTISAVALPPLTDVDVSEINRNAVDLYPLGSLLPPSLKATNEPESFIRTARSNMDEFIRNLNCLCTKSFAIYKTNIESSTDQKIVALRSNIILVPVTYFVSYQSTTQQTLNALLTGLSFLCSGSILRYSSSDNTTYEQFACWLVNYRVTEEMVSDFIGSFCIQLDIKKIKK